MSSDNKVQPFTFDLAATDAIIGSQRDRVIWTCLYRQAQAHGLNHYVADLIWDFASVRQLAAHYGDEVPFSFWYAVRNTGTNLASDHAIAGALVDFNDHVWRVDVDKYGNCTFTPWEPSS